MTTTYYNINKLALSKDVTLSTIEMVEKNDFIQTVNEINNNISIVNKEIKKIKWMNGRKRRGRL